MYKALSLISGGLDSLLATKLILEQGIKVTGINFFTGFSGDHDFCFKSLVKGKNSAKWVCDQLGIKLHVVDVASDFKPVLLKPQYGYGSNLNPCLDCKLFMIMQAKKWMEKQGFDFLITGEVLGQRPKSQRRDTLPIASKLTDDLIVRPLSAKLLKPTLPEREGWIKRELLEDISGRGRDRQINLAHKFGFKDIPQPGGGCSLTDVGFCRRLQDLLDHRPNQNYSRDDVLLLHVGRHLRIKSRLSSCQIIGKGSIEIRTESVIASRDSDEAIQKTSDKLDLKIIVGRNESENNFLEKFSDKKILLQTINCPGALVLLDGDPCQDDLVLAARIAAYFSKSRGNEGVEVLIQKPQGQKEVVKADSVEDGALREWYI